MKHEEKRRVLRLSLASRLFEPIATGRKRVEFRAITPYNTARIVGRKYDEIEFHVYRSAPILHVEYKGWHYGKDSSGVRCYALRLGRVLDHLK